MAESDFSHPNLTLHGRHVPEDPDNVDLSAYDVADPVTGVYEIGTQIDGVFVPIFRESASKVLGIVAHGKELKDKAAAAGSPVEPPPDTPARPQLSADELDAFRRWQDEQAGIGQPPPEPEFASERPPAPNE